MKMSKFRKKFSILIALCVMCMSLSIFDLFAESTSSTSLSSDASSSISDSSPVSIINSLSSDAASLGKTVTSIKAGSTLTTTAHTNYTYGSYNDLNTGVMLNYIYTPASNIKFVSLASTKSLSNSGYYGINGGFYNMGSNETLSIAEKNNTAVIGHYKSDGSVNYNGGWFNSGGGSNAPNRGTLVWDGSAFSTSVINSVNSLSSHVWAQGGISMNLGNTSWYTQAVTTEAMPNPTGSVYRSGMVGVSDRVLLFVTNTNCTATKFRSTIEHFCEITDSVGGTSTYKGIFLDGSGSSQLKCQDATIAGDSRALVQIIALVATT